MLKRLLKISKCSFERLLKLVILTDAGLAIDNADTKSNTQQTQM